MTKSNSPQQAGRPAGSNAPDDLPYPRKTDLITRRVDSIFVYVVASSLVAFIAWASLTELDKVARGSGRVIPQSQNQVVQHFAGGIVTEILVKEGDRVAKGAPLLRIENSMSRSELEQAKLELLARKVRIMRATAEVNGEDSISVPPELHVVGNIVERELSFFETRRKTLNVQLQILNDQQRQKEIELSELKARSALFRTERELIAQKLANIRKLAASGAVSTNELIDNERVFQQTEQRISEVDHNIPRAASTLEELSRRRVETILKFRTEAEKERSEAELQMAKLMETIGALTERSQRNAVLAPIDGVVNKLNVSTLGGVVKSGEPLLQLVPVDTSVAVEARLSPTDRAQVWPGLPAVIKISAYEFSTYGGLKGKVVEVSPDTLQDEKGQFYFRVRLEADGSSFGKDKPILPGMQADVDILYGRQLIITSLMRPVQRLQESALRQ
jgi:HlyD family type I secretion membrane fusion protein